MKARHIGQLDERGVTLPLIAVSLFAMLAFGALAVDLGSLREARSEAQRVADAVALAGASAFKDESYTDPAAVTEAVNRAMAVARANAVRSDTIDVRDSVTQKWLVSWPECTVCEVIGVSTPSMQLELNIIPDSQRVRAWVRHAGVATFFGGMLAKPYGHVQAMATAHATSAGVAKCVKPLALPDMWDETNTSAQDVDGDRVWDDGEPWDFAPPNDTYQPYDPDAPPSEQSQQTGYGSGWRNNDGVSNDWGRSIVIKAQRPGDAITSGWFYPWRIGNSAGGDDYRDNITGCNPATTSLGVEYTVENGNMVGPTRQGFDDLIAEDPNAVWNPSLDGGKGGVDGVDPKYGDWRNSPRVIPVALFDPHHIANIQSGGNLKLTFNNFALFFVEGFDGNGAQAPLKGRFLYFATGFGTGPVVGPLAKTLQLIQ